MIMCCLRKALCIVNVSPSMLVYALLEFCLAVGVYCSLLASSYITIVIRPELSVGVYLTLTNTRNLQQPPNIHP